MRGFTVLQLFYQCTVPGNYLGLRKLPGSEDCFDKQIIVDIYGLAYYIYGKSLIH